MFGLEKKLPGFIVHKKSIVSTTIFTGIFALAFLNFYSPFNIERWFHISQWKLFFYSSLVILTGMLVIVISRILLMWYKKNHMVSYLDYSIWVFLEISSMSVFYALFIKHVLNDGRELLEITKTAVKNTALVLLIPYTVLWLYYAYRDKTNQLKKLEKMAAPIKSVDKMISFFDDKGKHKITLQFDDLLFLKASDNYVSIHYRQNGKINKYLIRNTLKELEALSEEFKILRIHRSYLVNAHKVKVLKREKELLQVVLDIEQETVLPVSKTYISAVINAFSGETN